jgi:hypothetical protein
MGLPKRLLAALDRQHDDLHVQLASCGSTEGVVVFVVGRFFDANVACGERWGLEPMDKLAECAPWTVASEMHHHGERLCSTTVELNCDLLNLATHYGGTVTARAFGYDGSPGAELGVWTLPSPREPSPAVTVGTTP